MAQSPGPRRLRTLLSIATGLAVALALVCALAPLSLPAAALGTIEQTTPLTVACTSFQAGSSGACSVSGGGAGGTLSATITGPVTPSGTIAGPACVTTCNWTFTLTSTDGPGTGTVTATESGCPPSTVSLCPPPASTTFTVTAPPPRPTPSPTPVPSPTPIPVPTPIPSPFPSPIGNICNGFFVPATQSCLPPGFISLPPSNTLPPGLFPPFQYQPPISQPIYQPSPHPSLPSGYYLASPSPSASPPSSPSPSTPATVTISNTNPVVITIHANQFLDFTHSVTINVAPGVQATGVQVSTGTATIQGSQVVWDGFTLDAGDEATATVSLAATPGATLSAPGAPSIDSVSLSALDANGQLVMQSVPAGGPPEDSLTPSSLVAAIVLAAMIRPATPSMPVPSAPSQAAPPLVQPNTGGAALSRLLLWLALARVGCLTAGAWLLIRGRDRPARE